MYVVIVLLFELVMGMYGVIMLLYFFCLLLELGCRVLMNCGFGYGFDFVGFGVEYGIGMLGVSNVMLMVNFVGLGFFDFVDILGCGIGI